MPGMHNIFQYRLDEAHSLFGNYNHKSIYDSVKEIRDRDTTDDRGYQDRHRKKRQQKTIGETRGNCGYLLLG